MAETPLLKPKAVARRLNTSLRATYDMLAPGGSLHHLRIELGPKTIRVCPVALESHLSRGSYDGTA